MRGRWGLRRRSRMGLRSKVAGISAFWIRGFGLILILALFGCAGAHSGKDGLGSSQKRARNQFSGARVLENVRALSVQEKEGVEGCVPVSKRLRSRLSAMGASIEGHSFAVGDAKHRATETGPSTVAFLKGFSPDPILLIAPYTEACEDLHSGTSGLDDAAFLLELGRVLSLHPMRYSVGLVFVPEKGAPGEGQDQEGSPEATPWPELVRVASRLQGSGLLERVRVAVFFDGLGVADSAALRDSHSHPIYREVFWESARDLDLIDVFPPDAVFASSKKGHHALIQKGLRRTVMITLDAEIAPLASSNPGQDPSTRVQAEVFQSVGDVSFEAIQRIQKRLERIDGLSVDSGQD